MVENILLKLTGQGFEDFFNGLAKQKWGEDFESWKAPVGEGDFKCDGYYVPEQIVFQCYGPENPNPSTAAAKIRRDFQGAKNHFGERMLKWVFVYNHQELWAPCYRLMDSMREQNPDITIRSWCHEDLLRFALELPADRLARVCGGRFEGISFDGVIGELFEKFVADHKNAQPISDAAPSNQPSLEQALDDIATLDREIRRRLLGYSMWLEPMSKEQANEMIVMAGLDTSAIESNMERLEQMGLIRVTASHVLPVDKRICNEAAETFADEFIARLEVL